MLAWILGPLPDERSGYAARQKCGERAGLVGIGTNLVLFAVKLTIGLMSGAVSVIADALNNLSDSGTSLAMLFGFRIAGRPADAEHPFGHGRVEYLTGMLIAVVILLVGVELLHTSVEKLITPEPMKVSAVGLIVLGLSLFVKLWLAWFYRAVGNRIQSPALLAASTDSLSDCVATSSVIASLGAYHFMDINIDGAAGILVACFILYSGWGALKDAAQPLMGTANDPALAADIRELVFREKGVLGLHDLIIHGYGAGRTFATLHIELPAAMTLYDAHRAADRIEKRIRTELQIAVTGRPRGGSSLRAGLAHPLLHQHASCNPRLLRGPVPGRPEDTVRGRLSRRYSDQRPGTPPLLPAAVPDHEPEGPGGAPYRSSFLLNGFNYVFG